MYQLWAPTNDTLRWVEHVERLRVQGTQNQGKHSQCNSEYDESLMLVVHWYIRLVNQEIHEGPLPDSTESQQLPFRPSLHRCGKGA